MSPSTVLSLRAVVAGIDEELQAGVELFVAVAVAAFDGGVPMVWFIRSTWRWSVKGQEA